MDQLRESMNLGLRKTNMRIIFFGLGSIGLRHAQIIQKEYRHELFAFRSGKNKQGNPLNIPEISKWNDVKKINPDIAFITNPTALHIKTAQKCADLGMKLFIDKPIGDDLKGLKEISKTITKKNLVTYVGYNLRFHPLLIYLKKYIAKRRVLHTKIWTTSYLPNWRKGEDYKKSYRTNKNLGGGVILDLSHEFDYLEHLLGNIKIKTGQFSKRSNLTNNVEDYSDILLNSDNGPVSLHINFLSHKNRREIQIDLENETLIADLINCKIEKYKKEELVKTTTFTYERNDSFKSQLEYFFKNIDNPKMMNNLLDASILYKKIINFKTKK